MKRSLSFVFFCFCLFACLFDNRSIYRFILCCIMDLHYPDIGQTRFSVVNQREQKPVIALEMETNRKHVIAHLLAVTSECSLFLYTSDRKNTCIQLLFFKYVYNSNVLPQSI